MQCRCVVKFELFMLTHVDDIPQASENGGGLVCCKCQYPVRGDDQNYQLGFPTAIHCMMRLKKYSEEGD